MDLTSVFSDDQLAVMGCFAALAVCGTIASLTFHFGPAGKRSHRTNRADILQAPSAAESAAEQKQDRRAA